MTNQKGGTFERWVADYMAEKLDDDGIDRQVKTGSADKGDIRGVKILGGRVAVEVKNVAKLNLSGWVNEAEVERLNAGAVVCVVVHKRKGKGQKQMGQQYVTMTLDDLLVLVAAARL